MKKRISRIQRWLDRLSAACEKNRWDSALAEADCLSAEVREIREDLSKKLENEQAPAVNIFTGATAAMSIRSIGIALFIVLVTTIPLAVEAERPLTTSTVPAQEGKGNEEMLAWVTREEDELIRALRVDLSGLNQGKTETAGAFHAPVKKMTVPKVKKNNEAFAERPAEVEVTPGTETGISAEDLLALLQIGEKALRGDAPAVKVIK